MSLADDNERQGTGSGYADGRLVATVAPAIDPDELERRLKKVPDSKRRALIVLARLYDGSLRDFAASEGVSVQAVSKSAIRLGKKIGWERYLLPDEHRWRLSERARQRARDNYTRKKKTAAVCEPAAVVCEQKKDKR